MSWLDDLPANQRAELRDAGRIGNSRFEGPTKATCPECHRVFDLMDQKDAAEWIYGHDCEPRE